MEQWQSYKDISNASYNWQALLDETGANLLMISVTQQPALLKAMNIQTLWCEIYRDEGTVIYQRSPDSQTGHCGGE